MGLQVVLCVDEKTAIQALDRLDPVLPLSNDATVSTSRSRRTRASRSLLDQCPR
jgi:hypothetical protein